MSYIVLRGRWCNIIVLNMHSQGGEKMMIEKIVLWEIREDFCHFPQYHTKLLLGDFNAKLGREGLFKPTIGNESLHHDCNNNGVRIVNFATSRNLFVKIIMLPLRNSHKYTWISPDRKTQNKIDHILIDVRWHSSIVDVRSFRWAECDTDHYLAFAKVREDWQ